MTIIYFLIILTAVILMHELGHYLFARLFGVRVLEFAIGFGPKIFSKKGKKTEFRINPIPLGGYVKMAGENPYEENTQGIPDKELFNKKSAWKRFLITFAGPLFSILAGFLVFSLAGVFWGFPEVNIERVQKGTPAYEAGLRAGDRILTANGKTIIQNQTLSDMISTGESIKLEVLRNGEKITIKAKPARFPEEAYFTLNNYEGTTEGGKIQTINGRVFEGEFSKFSNNFEQSKVLNITFENGNSVKGVINSSSISQERYALGFYYSSFEPIVGKDYGSLKEGDRIIGIGHMDIKDGVSLTMLAQTINLDTSQIYLQFSGVEAEFIIPGFPRDVEVVIERNGTEQKIVMYKSDLIDFLGQPNSFKSGYEYWRPQNVIEAVSLGFQWATELLSSMVKIIGNLFTGQTQPSEFTGPLGIVQIVGAAAQTGLKTVFILVGFITLNLGVINLIPLPILDGGRMVLAVVEMVIRRRINPKVEGIINTIGFILLMAFILYITFIDIGRFF
ncbi:MAG: PDZ domain-containing protein [Kosmotoga sp.]|nr:MAG: PDZ domain-containing protein [Kosmotoga sp.]